MLPVSLNKNSIKVSSYEHQEFISNLHIYIIILYVYILFQLMTVVNELINYASNLFKLCLNIIQFFIYNHKVLKMYQYHRYL